VSIKRKKVLLIEDNPDHIEVYRTEMENSGLDVFYAQNQEKAIELAKKEEPNLILLDLMLGDVSGLDILKTLKNDPLTKDIKVIVLTAFENKELLEEERLKGALDYLVKDRLTPKEIVRKAKDYLDSI